VTTNRIAPLRRLAGLALLMSLTAGQAAAGQSRDVATSSAIGETARNIGGWLLSDLRRLRAFPHLDRAYRLIERAQWQAARHELETFIRLQPDSLEARRAYVLLLYRLTSYEEVIHEANALDARGDLAPNVWLYRGLARHARHEDRAAVDDFRRAIESGALEPGQRRFALSMLADVAIGVRQYPQALTALESLVREQDTFRVRFLRGLALDGLNRPVEAGSSFREALAVASEGRERVQAYTALADNASRRREWVDARDALVSALRLEPHDAGLASRLVEVAVSMHDCDPDALREILQVATDVKSQESLGRLLYSCGNYGEAADRFRRLTSQMTAAADRARIYTALGYSYTALQDYPRASTAFERAAGLRPNTDTLAALGRSRATEGRTRAAITAMRSALAAPQSRRRTALLDSDSSPPTRTELLMETARLELTNGDRAAALRDFGLVATSASDEATKVAAYQQVGFLQQSMGHFEAARTAFERVIQLTPNDAKALSALGEINLQLGAVDQSVKWFAKSAALSPSAAASQALAAAYARTGRLDDALAIYRRLLAASAAPAAESVRLLATIGALEFQAGRFADAATAYAQAFDLDPASDSDLLMRSARAWAAQGDWGATAGVSRKLLGRPGLTADVRAEAFGRLGLAYLNTNRIDEAIEALRHALAAVPDLTTQRSLAFALYKRADYAAALVEFRLVASRTSAAVDWIHVAQCLDGTGKPGLALTAWQHAASHVEQLDAADRFTVFLALGENYAHQGQFERAIEHWGAAWALQPTAEVGLRLVSAYRQAGRLSEALDLIYRLGPEVARGDLGQAYLDELARLQVARGSLEAAVITLGQALDLQRTPVRLYERGMCFFKMRRFIDALADFRAAIERDPTNDVYVEAVGYANKELRQYREAASAFKRAIELDPDRLSAYAELGDIALRTGDGKSAASWFSRVIDNRAFHPVRDEEQRAQLDRTIQRLRQQQATLVRPVEFATYVGTGPSQWHDASSPVSLSGQGSTGAAVITVPVPTGASSLARPLKVVGRLFWPVESMGPAPSRQLSVGLIYRPFANANIIAGIERLFGGPDGSSRWLLRGAYSKEIERQEGSEHRVDPYGLVFTEGAYAIGGAGDRQYSLEGRRGLTISFGDSWRLSPHVLADLRYQSGLATYPVAVEAGGGLHLRRLIGATPYVDHRAIFDTLIQYRGSREMGPRGGTTMGGWTWISVLHF
jgi:tetratricopeptide (TPR) repeat protein